MKGIKYAFILLLGLSLGLALPAAHAASGSPSSGIAWSESTRIYKPSGIMGAYYPRPLLLQDNTILLAFDTNEDDPAFTSVKVISSTDRGATWSTPVTVAQKDHVTCATPQLYQLANGEIWCSYRMSWQAGEDWSTSLNVMRSTDNGKTWEALPGGYEIDAAFTSGRYGGLWEPHIDLFNGVITVMYCDDSDRIGTQGAYQYILMKQWEGSGWSESSPVSAPSISRDGMPVWTQIPDGRYMVVFEATDTTPAGFGIRYQISRDGQWEQERLLLDKPSPGKVNNAPFLTVLTDGTLLCTWQSDEANKMSSGVNASSCYAIEGMLDGDTVKWGEKYRLFPVPDDKWSSMVSTLAIDANTVLAFCTSNEPDSGLYMKVGSYDGDSAVWEARRQAVRQPADDGQPAESPVRDSETILTVVLYSLLGLLICLAVVIFVLLLRRRVRPS